MSQPIHLLRKQLLFACVFALAVSSAHADNVDWKLYGAASVGDGDQLCFYDANGVRKFDGRVRVWTKCLLTKELDTLDPNNDRGKSIVEKTARKVVDGYVPPMAIVEDVNFDQAMGFISYEVTANVGDIDPRVRIYYEISCSEQQMRTLSVHIKSNGKQGFNEKPSTRYYASPETNGNRLIKILCPMQ